MRELLSKSVCAVCAVGDDAWARYIIFFKLQSDLFLTAVLSDFLAWRLEGVKENSSATKGTLASQPVTNRS
jgi:hypothetical protein